MRGFEIISRNDSSASKHRHILNIPDTAVEASQAALASNQAARFRSEMGHISRHSAVFLAGTLFTAGAGYLFKIYLARVLGAEALGIYALGMTVVGFFGLFTGLGLPQATVRFVAAYSATEQWSRLQGFLRRAFGLLGISNVMLAAAMITAGPWLARSLYHAPTLVPYLHLFAAVLVLGSFVNFLGQVLAGYKDVALRTIITSFIGSPLNIIFGVLLLGLGFGLRGYLLAQVASATMVLLTLLVAAWRLTPKAARQVSHTVVPMEREVFWFSAAVFGVSLLEFTLAQSDKILLGVFLDVRQAYQECLHWQDELATRETEVQRVDNLASFYPENKTSLAEWLQYNSWRLETHVQRDQAIFEHIVARAKLERAVGRPLDD